MERIINALAIDEDSDHLIQQLRNRVSLEEISRGLENTFPPLRSRPSLQQQETLSDADCGPSLPPSPEYLKPHPPELMDPIESWQGTSFTSQSQRVMEDEPQQPYPGFEVRWTEVTSG